MFSTYFLVTGISNEKNMSSMIVWIQVNLCQKHLFTHQLTHNMTKDCSLIYQFYTWKLQSENMGRKCCAHKLVFVLTFRTIFAHNMFSPWPCSELLVFMYWTGKSMSNRLSYCGLVDPRISASNKDLPVLRLLRLHTWILLELVSELLQGKLIAFASPCHSRLLLEQPQDQANSFDFERLTKYQ